MPWKIDTDKELKYNNLNGMMEIKTAVKVSLLSLKGACLIEQGPLYAESGQEVFELTQLLKQRAIEELSNGRRQRQ